MLSATILSEPFPCNLEGGSELPDRPYGGSGSSFSVLESSVCHGVFFEGRMRDVLVMIKCTLSNKWGWQNF